LTVMMYVTFICPSLLMRVQLGDSVTLTCFCPEETTFVAWLKQAVGQKPQLMAKAPRYVSGKFDEEYENIKRYSLQNAKGSFNLTISNAEPSDSAVYYCAAVFLHEVTFGNGTFVIITGKWDSSYFHICFIILSKLNENLKCS
uniref:Ig-like domain-containing protein n=1 Tax=Paramormyrops kingsleyae TaxID=1676925 RepID=A0A3B3R4Q1_9TELE